MGTHVAGLALQVADGRMNRVVAQRAYRLVETKLVVAHAGTAVREVRGAELVGQFQALLHDDITIRAQHRILLEHARTRPQQRHHELIPQRLAGIKLVMLGRAQRPARSAIHAFWSGPMPPVSTKAVCTSKPCSFKASTQ
jgi:hypothetical protein